jgi:hypothetical protein
MPEAPTARQIAGCLVLVAIAGCCGFLLVFRWDTAGFGWPAIAYGVIAVFGGATAGSLLASRDPLSGLLAGACSGVGSVCAAVWASARLASPDSALIGAVALAGVVPGIGVYHPLCWLHGWATWATSDRRPRPSDVPMAVIYDLPPEPPDPRAAHLEERLLHLCKQDRRLFERLLHYERTQYPGRRRVELLRLAIEHFEQDNR